MTGCRARSRTRSSSNGASGSTDVLYFDASAFVKLLLREEGSDEARSLWNLDVPGVTSWITYTETSAALGAACRLGRIGRGQLRAHVRSLDSEWRGVTALAVDGVVAERAGAVAVRRRVRGMDALHIATALSLDVARPVLVTWDSRLARAAHDEGLAVAGISPE